MTGFSCRAGLGSALAAALALGACTAPEPYFDLLDELPLAEAVATPNTIDLGAPGARPFLGPGWSSQDERWAGTWSFVWATGATSTVRFHVIGDAPSVIRFRARPADSPSGETQVVTARLNGMNLGSVELAPGANVYPIPLPDGAVVDGVNELELSYAFHVGATGTDSRDRAVAWDWLRMVVRGDSAAGREEPATVSVGASGLQLPLGTRLDYYLDLRPRSALVLEAVGSGNHPGLRLAVETLDAGGTRQTSEVTAGELAAGVRLEVVAAGPARLSLRAIADPSGRGATLRAARLEAGDAVAPDIAAPPHSIRLARPNIIVYLVDTLRADHLGAYGYTPPTSPALDAMAAEGIVFERMFAQSGWTRTSVASLMTGLNPPVHGILGRADALPEEAITLPVLMGDLGYETVAVITNSNVSDTFGFDRGFTAFRYLREQARDLNPEVHRLSDDVNTEFFSWLDGQETDRPFFAYLHTSDPHAPYAPREPYLGQFLGVMRRSGITWPRDARAFAARQDGFTATQVRDEMVALYDAEIAFNDSQFGHLLAGLKERGLDQNTVVIFTADHGEEFLDHDDYGHGKTLYRELVRVPLVVRLPSREAAGTRPEVTAQHVDLLPTIVEMGGGTAPAWAQGQSLLPALADASWKPQVQVRSYLELDVSSVASLIAGDWHLLRSPMEASRARTLGLEMFDLAADPAEAVDLRAQRDIVAGLLLTAWRRAEANEEPLFAIDTAEIDEELAARLRDLGYIR